MLRPDKKYSVYDLRQLKRQCGLTHVLVKSPEVAAAAEAAGIDLRPPEIAVLGSRLGRILTFNIF